MDKIPEWARAMRRKNTEVRVVKGRCYLYETHCHYVKEEKKRRKTVKYLGALVEGVGLVPRGGREEAIRGASTSDAADRIRELEAQNADLRRELEALRAASGTAGA